MKNKIQALIEENKSIIKSNKDFYNIKGTKLTPYGRGIVLSRIETLEKQNKQLLLIIK